jgi:hypothetical protein
MNLQDRRASCAKSFTCSASASPNKPCTSMPGRSAILRRRPRLGNAGFASCAHWLSWRVGWDRGTVADRLRVANKLPTLPKVAAKLEAGELSYSKARAIARVATPASEEVLLLYAKHLPAAQLERVCAKVKIVAAAASSMIPRSPRSPRLLAPPTPRANSRAAAPMAS